MTLTTVSLTGTGSIQTDPIFILFSSSTGVIFALLIMTNRVSWNEDQHKEIIGSVVLGTGVLSCSAGVRYARPNLRSVHD